MQYKTQRLILRPWKESDADSLFTYARDERVGPAAGWPVHTSTENSLEIIRSVFSRPDEFAICLRESGMPIGAIGLMYGEDTALAENANEAEIGYWIGVPFWGQGYMTEAVQEVIRLAFEERNIHKLWCGYFEGNERSHRVQEKCGFCPAYVREKVEVPLLHEVRKEYVTVLERETWRSGHVTIRQAQLEDIDQVNVIRRQVNDIHVKGRPDIFRPGFSNELRDEPYVHFGEENRNLFVAVLDDNICGLASVQYLEREESPYCLARKFYRVEEFGVDAAYRRRGVATALIKHIERDAFSRGYDKVELDMWEFNTGALAFYESVGFETFRRYMELWIDK